MGRAKANATVDSYFLSNRNLRWPSIALSTIATNINGYQFLGMMGSAYLYGLAQANLEINAIQGILMAAFIFVPLYLKDGIITITQFIKTRLGERVGLFYTIANILTLFYYNSRSSAILGSLCSRFGFRRILRVYSQGSNYKDFNFSYWARNLFCHLYLFGWSWGCG